MKRYGHLYQEICDIDNILEAHRNARKGKTHYAEVRTIDRDPERYAKSISTMLTNHLYRTSPYKVFTKFDSGKEREIYVLPYYPDRIVQWAVVQVLEPIWERTLIAQTYSSIKGRGIHRGLMDVQQAMMDVEGTAYCLKLDVRKFYPSIDHALLKNIVRRKIKDPEVLELLDDIIGSVGDGRGVPIGNYLSQFFGNLYLSGFDHWMKEVKWAKHYFRYCDDIVILDASKERLHLLRVEIESYLRNNLHLTLKDNWQVFPTRTRGLDFLGYRMFGDRTLLRKSTAMSMKQRMGELNVRGKWDVHARSSIASYLGWMRWCDASGLEAKYIAPLLRALGGTI